MQFSRALDGFLSSVQGLTRASRKRRCRTKRSCGAAESLEVRLVPSATAFNTAPDIYAFDPTGGAMMPPPGVTYPKNAYYINNTLAATLSPSVTVNKNLAGDFDGDGDLDVAAQIGNDWYVGIRTGNVLAFSVTPWGTLGGVNYTDYIVGDFYTVGLSDGKEDIAVRDANGQWLIAASDGTAFSIISTGAVWSRTVGYEQVQKLDIGGDGNDDIVGLYGVGAQLSSANIKGLISTGSTFSAPTLTRPDARTNYMGFYMFTGITNILVGDFNRDGKDDLVAWNRHANHMGGPNKVYVGVSVTTDFNWGGTEAGGGTLPWAYANIFDVANTHPMVGDFNGDSPHRYGDDLIWYGSWGMGGRPVYALLSNGTNAFNTSVTTPATPGTAVQMGTVWISPLMVPNGLQVGDFNGDGRDDVWVAETNGTGFVLFSQVAPPLPSGIAGFTFNRVTWFNWSFYPHTYRIFQLIGRYYAT